MHYVYIWQMITLEKYNEVSEEFACNGCKLLSTFEDCVIQTNNASFHYSRLSFIGVCGHESSAVYTNYHNRKTGLYCKKCILEKSKTKRKEKDKEIHNKQEAESIQILTFYIESEYEVKRTWEGCNADLLIRKKGNDNDEWIQVQVKTTKGKCHKMYAFHTVSDAKYKDMMIICHSMEDNKVWVFPYNSISIPKNFNISERSKYNAYLCDINAIPSAISLSINECKIVSEAIGNTPNNKYQQREIHYAKKRQEKLNFLQYDPVSHQLSGTDFIVNGKNVQEKVVGSRNNKSESYLFQLARKNGAKARTYRLGENDMYWFHSAFNELFWIVPEAELHKAGLISDKEEIKPAKHFAVNVKTYKTKEWLKPYELSYDNITNDTISKIKGLFSIL